MKLMWLNSNGKVTSHKHKLKMNRLEEHEYNLRVKQFCADFIYLLTEL